MDKRETSEREESKVLVMADKWYDAKVKKIGVVRECERALENAVTDLRRKREKLKPP